MTLYPKVRTTCQIHTNCFVHVLLTFSVVGSRRDGTNFRIPDRDILSHCPLQTALTSLDPTQNVWTSPNGKPRRKSAVKTSSSLPVCLLTDARLLHSWSCSQASSEHWLIYCSGFLATSVRQPVCPKQVAKGYRVQRQFRAHRQLIGIV